VGKLGFFLSVIMISVAVTSFIVNIHLFGAINQLNAINNQINDDLSELRARIADLPLISTCKQSPAVQKYLSQHPNAECSVMKLFVKSDGSVYTIDSSWELDRYVGGTQKPRDGKDHYCWRFH
jgi:hypothetical protein